MTASQCSCQDGWSGTGCNVCRNSDACQSAFRSVGGASGGGGGNGLLNETLVCSDTPRVWAAGQMSCQVIVSSLSFSPRLFQVSILFACPSFSLFACLGEV